MKAATFLYSIILVSALCCIQLSSCSKKDDTIQVTQATTDGNWRVSFYFDNSDETNKFSGYNFTFSNGGQVTATNGSNTITGSWSLGSSKFTISFGATPVFGDLNNDWLIEEKTVSNIKLKDDNVTKVHQLHFVKL